MKHTSKKLEQLKALSFNEFLLLLKSSLLLPLISISLKSKGYKWTRSLLENHVPDHKYLNKSKIGSLEEAQKFARIVSIASRHGAYNATCLIQALLTWWLLARRGIQTDLLIGVNNQEAFKAHAWVEYQGDVLIDRSDIRVDFSVFKSS